MLFYDLGQLYKWLSYNCYANPAMMEDYQILSIFVGDLKIISGEIFS